MSDVYDFYNPDIWDVGPTYDLGPGYFNISPMLDYGSPSLYSSSGFDLSNLLGGLGALGGSVLSKALGVGMQEPATPGFSMPKTNKAAQSAAMSTQSYLNQLLNLAGSVRSNPYMQALALQQIPQLQALWEGDMKIAGTSLLDYIKSRPQLSDYTKQAVDLAQKMAHEGQAPEELMREIYSTLGTSVRGIPPEQMENLAAKMAQGRTAQAANIFAQAGKQEEDLISRWATVIGPLSQQYSQIYGPEGTLNYIKNLMDLYNIDTMSQIALLSQLGVPIANLAQMFAGLSKTGQVQIGGTAAQPTAASSIFSALSQSPDLWKTVGEGLSWLIDQVI